MKKESLLGAGEKAVYDAKKAKGKEGKENKGMCDLGRVCAGKRKIFWALERKQWTMQGKINEWKERRKKRNM